MKQSLKLMLIFVLGAGVLTLNSYSDEVEEENPTPATPNMLYHFPNSGRDHH
jgi:hypothetical protein